MVRLEVALRNGCVALPALVHDVQPEVRLVRALDAVRGVAVVANRQRLRGRIRRRRVDAVDEGFVDAAVALAAGVGDVGAVYARPRIARRQFHGARVWHSRAVGRHRQPGLQQSLAVDALRRSAPQCGSVCRCSAAPLSGPCGGTWRKASARCARTSARPNRSCPGCRACRGNPCTPARPGCPAPPTARACSACNRSRGWRWQMEQSTFGAMVSHARSFEGVPPVWHWMQATLACCECASSSCFT